jgi:hypothetical protein
VKKSVERPRGWPKKVRSLIRGAAGDGAVVVANYVLLVIPSAARSGPVAIGL